MSETPEEFFDRQSDRYSEAIERCVPRYREMLEVLLGAVPPERPPRRILELGCGTGLLTQALVQRWPEAQILAVDVSGEALQVAAQRLGSGGTVELQRCPMERLELRSGSRDLVVSSIAIHHLVHAEKARLFQAVRNWLRPGGDLVLADQCAGATEHLDRSHKRQWRRLAQAQGLTEAEWQAWRLHEDRHDHHATLDWHLEALQEAGFTPVDCVWRHLLWCVLYAHSPGTSR